MYNFMSLVPDTSCCLDAKTATPSTSSSLALRHPTAKEITKIWAHTSTMWADTLPPPLYLKEQSYLTTVPLAKDGGMTSWVLVDANLPPDERHILSSCETYRKRALVSHANGYVEEGIVHGVASVYCPEEFRGKGYAGKMMRELSEVLRTWQTHDLPCVGSILYSDIGRQFYAKLGWHPNATNTHIELEPMPRTHYTTDIPIYTSHLADLCKRDEALLRKSMAATSSDGTVRMAIIPDVEHMLWHHAKQEFTCKFLFGRIPDTKGAIAGYAGNKVYAIWTRRYYDHLDAEQPHNVLYILRLGIEADPTATRFASDAQMRPAEKVYKQTVASFKAVMRAAQAEAAEWKLDGVQIWDPTPLTKELLRDSGLEFVEVEREKEHIASLLWYGDGGVDGSEPPLWVNCEHYAWM
jgi:hypothetical protein